jgi:Tfp pilus assembly protein PilV
MAQPNATRRRSPRLLAEDGISMVEVLVAVLILAIGILGLVGAFDSARKLNLLSERRTLSAHRAQLEIERLQAVPFEQLAMVSAPSHSSVATNPDYYVNYSSPVKCSSVNCFAWNSSKPSEEESLVIAAKSPPCEKETSTECGVVAISPTGRKCTETLGACEWTDGNVSGNVYPFVTWHTDPVCEKEEAGKAICATFSYKRITVIVTVTVPNGRQPTPTRVSTLIAEPGS